MNVEVFKEFRKKVNDNVSKVIVGKEDKIDKKKAFAFFLCFKSKIMIILLKNM